MPARFTARMPGYETKHERVAVSGVDDLIIRSLLDRQQRYDPLGEAEALGISSAAWPLFGLLWPSGVQLAAKLALRPVTAGERILEMGCGLALASLVGHRRGADVTASDCHPLTSSFLNENVRLNGMRPLKYRHGHWADVGTDPLKHGPGRIEKVSGQFDLLIGSDLLYERDLGGALAGFIGRHAAPGAQVWIVDPDRGNRPAFHRSMAAEGFERRESRMDRPVVGHTLAYKGRLLEYRRSEQL